MLVELIRTLDPRAIHQRYVKSREDWYKAQPPGTWLGNRQYRKAMGLPLGYPKASYSWCLDYKQMGRYCKTSTGLREWTKEEMMAYLDWYKAETDRIEARVAEETENGRLFTSRRGMGELWEMAQRDIDEQEALYSAAEQEETGFKSTTLHDTFVNMAWIWMLTNNFDVEWVEMDPLWK